MRLSNRPELPHDLDIVLRTEPLTDWVRIYKTAERPASEVIVVDPCPKELLPGELVYYKGLGDPPGPGP